MLVSLVNVSEKNLSFSQWVPMKGVFVVDGVSRMSGKQRSKRLINTIFIHECRRLKNRDASTVDEKDIGQLVNFHGHISATLLLLCDHNLSLSVYSNLISS